MIYLFERDSNKELEGRLLQAITKKTGMDFTPYKNDHKIIFFDNKNDFYGGAFVKEGRFSDYLPSELKNRKEKASPIFHGLFFFDVEKDTTNREYSFEYYYHLFFRRVYQQAYHLARQHKMDPLFLHVSSEAMDDINTFGQWPSKWHMLLNNNDIFMCLEMNEAFSKRCDEPLDPLCPRDVRGKPPTFLNDLHC